MLGWLKRAFYNSSVETMNKEFDRFILSLQGMDADEIAMIVAFATHWRYVLLREEGIDVLRPAMEEQKDPYVAYKLNRLIADVQNKNPVIATGVMVWLFTFRATIHPEMRLKGRRMWSELCRGFPHVLNARESVMVMTGADLNVSDYDKIPENLLPEVS